MSHVTQILSQIEGGDPSAAEQLLPLVYQELRKLAAAKLSNEMPGQTLQATALVHEAYLRLVQTPNRQEWNGRGHFFAAAAEAMRRILVERARAKRSQRRGGNRQRYSLSDEDIVTTPIDDQLLDLNDALSRLSEVSRRAADVVKLRIFAGMTIEEIAAHEQVAPSTVRRSWVYARAWLGRELERTTDRNC